MKKNKLKLNLFEKDNNYDGIYYIRPIQKNMCKYK